jgi:hypothetical protein
MQASIAEAARKMAHVKTHRFVRRCRISSDAFAGELRGWPARQANAPVLPGMEIS